MSKSQDLWRILCTRSRKLAFGVIVCTIAAYISLLFMPAGSLHRAGVFLSISNPLPDSDGLLPLPAVYKSLQEDEQAHNITEACTDRFGTTFLRQFGRHRTQICNTDTSSQLTCFTHQAHDTRVDSFCVGFPFHIQDSRQGQTAGQRKLNLECPSSYFSKDMDLTKAMPNIFFDYWYKTGPKVVIESMLEIEGDPPSEPAAPSSRSSQVLVLVKREGANNLWHSMMQIMALVLSLDVLVSTAARDDGTPYLTRAELRDSQIVIIDDFEHGPYWDIWTILTGNPNIRVEEIGVEANNSGFASKVVLPLPGAANPIWTGDWTDIDCGKSALLKAFVQRIKDHYRIHDRSKLGGSRVSPPLTITLINRTPSRVLVNQNETMAFLTETYPDFRVRLIDFAVHPFAEQIALAHSTDILIGVHGAGLTHGFFLSPSAVMIELQPPGFSDHRGFANMAKFLGGNYVRSSAIPVDFPGKVEENRFMDPVMVENATIMAAMTQALAIRSAKLAGS